MGELVHCKLAFFQDSIHFLSPLPSCSQSAGSHDDSLVCGYQCQLSPCLLVLGMSGHPRLPWTVTWEEHHRLLWGSARRLSRCKLTTEPRHLTRSSVGLRSGNRQRNHESLLGHPPSGSCSSALAFCRLWVLIKWHPQWRGCPSISRWLIQTWKKNTNMVSKSSRPLL